MKERTAIIITAIICLTVIEIVCLFKNIDSAILVMVISLIAGLAGYKTGRRVR